MKKEKSPGALRFLDHLERAKKLRRQVITGEGLTAQQHALSTWQTKRLASTYDDFAAQRRYQSALEFFLTDLYGTKDFAQRDADIERVYPIMVRVLSENALQSMSLAVELHALSQELDSELTEILRRVYDIDIGERPELLDQQLYAKAYRQCDNYALRSRQIELICETGRLLDEVVRHPVIYMTAKLARAPAHAAGFGELQDFIERGFRSFRTMKGAGDFLAAVKLREFHILNQVYSGDPLTDWSAAYFS
ncbi:MAG: hypothetical protein OER80_11495 [Gammaproteobacteria bacterium]|nr:hypothetical protein [Gammaproteobacteria bacterium]MDH3767279.1 hypothetical protein [Gammaproteobacteria bacterium]